MFKRILVPIDGSHTSSLGFAQALALAREQGATLCVLHIVDELIVTQGLDSAMVTAPSYVDELLDDLRANGRKLLATAVAKAQKAGVATVSILVETIGHRVADAIIAQAKKQRADLIVLGTHGRRGLSRLVLGSDAEGVVRLTRVPVLLIRSASDVRPRRKQSRK